ncbi:Spindle pole body protein pcp1 [Talaromyces islandicus]|uniref:Spindle pole body protein pcp1 n=1 Tax=Talaromyces islandicus TaxID=28573 RepID=A0A0U1M8G5_TALIS|nr:Spindle pole body protein pcp1 [Talaromyces islandicus]
MTTASAEQRAAMEDEMEALFDDHPSLSASLEDFEASNRRSPMFDLPSQHSGFRSEESDDGQSDPQERWSPPALRRPDSLAGSHWYRHAPYDMKPTLQNGSAPQSREGSPQYEDAREAPPLPLPQKNAADWPDITLAANVPLPPGTDSPVKGRSVSPEPKDRRLVTTHEEANSNYVRFRMSAEVAQREPLQAAWNALQLPFDRMFRSKASAFVSILVAFLGMVLLRVLTLPQGSQSIPNLVKLCAFARNFEPLIYYSENGVQHISNLQETGIAVWDLGESVRGSNMTSAPIIVTQLDELSGSLKDLSLELTRFFANVDSDIDSILLVMDWTRRELTAIHAQPPSSLPSIVIDNIYGMISQVASLEQKSSHHQASILPGESSSAASTPTILGTVVTSVLGPTSTQRTNAALMRTFTEFLNVLEESINSELSHSTALIGLFESIDRQFLNLQRVVVRESDTQEREEGELLSSLWTRLLGGNKDAIRKYEKNRKLLADVRRRTVSNKHQLMDHQARLLNLKASLETLRRRLVSPLVRQNESRLSSTTSTSSSSSAVDSTNNVLGAIEGQIKGVDDTYEYLRGLRESQKAKLMDLVYGAGRTQSSHGYLGLDETGE